MEDEEAIIEAPEEIVIEGVTVRLNAFPGRDRMPSPMPDPSMRAVLQVVQAPSGCPVDGVTGIRAWYVSGREIWLSSIFARPSQVGGIEYGTESGPSWDVDRVDLVLEFEDRIGSRHRLIARNRAVFTTY